MIPTTERVTAQNQLNNAANVAQEQLRAVLVDWMGRKVWKISGHGGPVAKLKTALADLDACAGWNQLGGPMVSVIVRHGLIQAFFRGTYAGRQLSCELFLGRVDGDGILTRLDAWERRRTDYTVDEVRRATERAYELECEARKLRRSVSDFLNR